MAAKKRRNQTPTQHRVLYLIVRRRLAAFAALAYQVGVAKKNKRAGRHADHGVAGDRDWEYSPRAFTLALVPYWIGTKPVAAGAGPDGGDFDAKVGLGKPELVSIGAADADERSRVYEALLELRWIEPAIQRAVLHALGRSYRVENQNYRWGRDAALQYRVDEVAARMRANGEHPRCGRREAARAEVAAEVGIDAETLRRRFQRLNRR